MTECVGATRTCTCPDCRADYAAEARATCTCGWCGVCSDTGPRPAIVAPR